MADALVVYAARMASLAVRRSNAKLILNGLIAIALDDDLLDRRDVGASLCLLCDAARRIQAFDPNEVKTIMEIAVPVRKKLVELCLKQLTTPERMGFTPSGFAKTFLYTPPPI
jgi:hypothetical protein